MDMLQLEAEVSGAFLDQKYMYLTKTNMQGWVRRAIVAGDVLAERSRNADCR